MSSPEKPNFLYSLFTMKCPRCRRGPMFTEPNPWKLKQTLKMPHTCPECSQPFELEVGFWYGTGYVSYGLSFFLSLGTFLLWWAVIGLSTEDSRFFIWMAVNAVFLIGMQPWIMRLSRVVYLYFFVSYDGDYKQTSVREFDYKTGSYYRKDEEDNK
jgi:hypothetical protein